MFDGFCNASKLHQLHHNSLRQVITHSLTTVRYASTIVTPIVTRRQPPSCLHNSLSSSRSSARPALLARYYNMSLHVVACVAAAPAVQQATCRFHQPTPPLAQVLEALAPQESSSTWVPVDVELLNNVRLTAASLPDDALPSDDCATLVAGLQLANGAVSIQHADEVVEGMPLTTLVVNGDVIHTESFSTMTAMVGTAGTANAISVTYTARQGHSGVETYTIQMGNASVLKLSARAGEPRICVKGSVAAAF